MTGFDADTERGLVAVANERRVRRIFERRTNIRLVTRSHRLHRESGALVDGVLVKDGRLIGCMEIKSRGLVTATTLATFRGRFESEWLVTAEKIAALRLISKMLKVPGVGLLYFPSDDVLLARRICDRDGALVCRMCEKRTRTRATINGGSAVRMNAFIDMSDATEYRGLTPEGWEQQGVEYES